MSVSLSVIELRKIYTFVKLQCILIMLNISLILCYIMLLRIILHMSFNFGNNILITYQNSPKSVFIYLYWFKLLVWYNLVLCYSLDLVLVIWHITLINFLSKSSIFL